MFVARFTNNPEADVKRNWSAWMGVQAPTVRKFFDLYIYDEIEDLDDMTDDDMIEWLMDNQNIDLRYNDAIEMWCSVHHEGLSCWNLEAETVEEAIEEAKTANISWSGFGSATVGKVALVAKVEDIENLYIFQCDSTTVEA